VPDFRLLPDRLEASLSFNQRNFFCVIPYEAVYLSVSHSIKHGVLFAQSVPVEMLEYFAAEAQKEEEAIQKSSRSPKLKVVAGKTTEGDSDSGSSESIETSTQTNSKDKKSKRGHLRIVK
jgi:hypothetical protein